MVMVVGVMGGGGSGCRGGQDGGGRVSSSWMTHIKGGNGRWKRCQAIDTKYNAWEKAFAPLGADGRID